jgi:hypothetical protein
MTMQFSREYQIDQSSLKLAFLRPGDAGKRKDS